MVDLLRCELRVLLDLFLTSFRYIDQPNTDQKCFIHLLHDCLLYTSDAADE